MQQNVTGLTPVTLPEGCPPLGAQETVNGENVATDETALGTRQPPPVPTLPLGVPVHEPLA